MSAPQVSVPVLQPVLIYGLRTEIRGNANFLTDEDILYPAGGLMVLNNITQKRQNFIKLPDKGIHCTKILVSPNLKLIAVGEGGDRPAINIYDVGTLKKKKHIQVPPDREINSNLFETFQFTFDSKLIVAVSGDPDWNMYVFKCDKGKLESMCKANNLNGTGTIADIACNPNDTNLLALVGKHVFKIIACQESTWRQFGYNKADNLNLTCAAWMTQDRLMATTVDGKFMIFESGDLKAIFWAGDLPILNLKYKEKDELAPQQSQTNISEPSCGSMHLGEDYQIRSLVMFNKGFAFGFLNGTVHLYEKENPTKYIKRNVFKIPDHNIIREESDRDFVMNEVNALSINPSQDRLLVTCNENQLYQVKLWGLDLNMSPEIMFTELGPPLHQGKIGGLAVCAWKPIFITTGTWDRTIRVWNYETETLELCKQFPEDIYGVALHPTGLYAIVGFSDKLRFLTIMIDDFISNREFPIRKCRECSFSSMGQYFAACNGNLIQVYNTITFENVYNLRGHNGMIRAMSWTPDDYKMTSCGMEGTIYDWEVTTTKRINEIIYKSVSFHDVSTTTDGKSSFAISSDGYLREFVDGNLHREVIICEDGMQTLALSHSNQMIFVTGNGGIIYSVALPILDTAEYLEFAGHSCEIERMKISYDDRFLITCSSDSLIAIWKLLNTEGKAVKMDKEFVPSTDIVISREDLEEKLETIHNLQTRMHELLTEHSYQMRNTEVIHSMKLKEIHEGYCSAIEDLKEKNENLEAEHAQEISNMLVEMSQVKIAHEQFVQVLEVNYNDKLIVEYDKLNALEDKMTKMRAKYELELENLREAKILGEETIRNEFIHTLHEKEIQIEELLEETKAKTREHELIKQQIEDDADREIYEMKTLHEKCLKEEQDNNVRLRGETGILKKKLLSSQKQVDELKHAVYTLENEHTKFKSVIIGLDKDIADLKKEILERDETIQDKEKRIYQLKRKNQEVEKFKFILDFKIKELKSQIEPKERQIREQSEQINDMVNELENLQKIIMNLDLQLTELREKLSAADNEIRREVFNNKAAKAALKTIRNDIHYASGLVQDIPKLTRCIKNMYHKYNADKDFEMMQAEDQEAKNEFLRQRDFLERTIETLQKQVSKNYSAGGVDKIRLVDENSVLIEETNGLRKNLKFQIKQTKQMESLLGLSTKYMLPKVAQKKLNDATATAEQIHAEYKEQIHNEETVVDAMKTENHRLVNKIIEEKEEAGNFRYDEDSKDSD